MRSYHQEKNLFKKILSSKLTLLGSLVLLVFISVALGKAVYKRYQIQKEIAQIEKEIEKAEGRNKELNKLIEYLSTDAFREKMARQKLNLKREGETVIAIPVKPPEEKSILAAEEKSLPEKQPLASSKLENPKKWWHHFFSNN